MTRYLGGMIGGKLDRKSELNPADWTNTNIAEDYAHVIPVITADQGSKTGGFTGESWAASGKTIAISGDGLTAAIGIQSADQNTSNINTGVVIVYEWQESLNKWLPASNLMYAGMYASDRQASDHFGTSVAIDSDGSTIAVGAPYEDTGGDAAGKVYIFEKGSGWVNGSTNEVAMLRTSTDTTNSNVGRSVALSADGQTLLVGAPGQSSSQGSAFIFEKPAGGWVTGVGSAAGQELILLPSDAGAFDYFGYAVALSADGNTALVSSYAEDGAGNAYDDTGAAYIFERHTNGSWNNSTEVAKLTASNAGDGSTNDFFGQYALALSGDGSTAVVGVPSDDGVANEYATTTSGAVYIYEKGAGWTDKTEDVALRPDNLYRNYKFGEAVEISDDGNTIVASAQDADYKKGTFYGTNVGSVYIFEKNNGWVDAPTNQVTELFSPIVQNLKRSYNFDQMGYSLSITPDASRILVGCDDCSIVFHKPTVATYNRPGTENNKRFPRVIPNNGILDLNTAGAQETDAKALGYNRTQIFTPDDVIASEIIGNHTQALAISRDGLTCVVGSYKHTISGISSAGAAYVFEYTNNSWTQVAKLTSSTGPAAADYFGTAVAISDDGSTVTIGAMQEDVLSTNAGALFVFERPGAFGTWTDTTEDAYLHPAASSIGLLGCAVAISGDGTTIFGGAYDEHTLTGVTDGGAVYVFEKGAGWTNGSSNLVAEFHSDSPATDDSFGMIVRCSQDGTTLAIGAGNTDSGAIQNTGTVYIFEKGAGWTDGSSNQSAKLTASNAQLGDNLTNSSYTQGALGISDDGNTVVAGANYADVTNSISGKAFIWEKNGSWTDATEDYALFEAGDTPSNGSVEGRSSNFGYGIAISGNGEKIFVGAYNGYLIDEEANNDYRGAVHIFEKGSGWKNRLGSRTEVLSAPEYDTEITFSKSIAVSSNGNMLLCGAEGDDPGGISNAGSIHAFKFDNNATEKRVLSRSGFGRIIGNNKFDITYSAIPGSSDWVNNPKDFHEYDITLASNSASYYYGANTALSYDGTRYVVSSVHNTSGRSSVYIYDFVNGRWQLNFEIFKPDTNGAYFGAGIAISDDGNTIAIGAYGDEIIHVYEYINLAWIKVAELTPSAAGISRFGNDVAISGDGNTIVTGSNADQSELPSGGGLTSVGGLWVFEKPTNGWTNATQDGILYSSTVVSNYSLGYTGQTAGRSCVHISKDGSIISANAHNAAYDQGSGNIGGAGAMIVFKRPGVHGTWANATESARLEKDYLGSTSGHTMGYYGSGMSKNGNTIISGDNTNNRIYVWEKSADSDWSNAVSNTYVALGEDPLSFAISEDGNTIITTGSNAHIDDLHFTRAHVNIHEKGAGWSNSTSNSIRKLAPWHSEFESATRASTAISGDGSVFSFGAYTFDIDGTDAGGSFVWDNKKYEEKPVMNKTGMFSLKDMYQSKLTES